MTGPGAVALVGGDEFRRACDPLDRALLALAGGPSASVAILPTAATNENPDVAGDNGVRHFGRLGAVAEKLMIVDRESAADPALVDQLARHTLIYLTGGDPAYLLETLTGSPAWQEILGVQQRGGLVAGSSAGAMVLASALWRVDRWAPGLGLAPGLAVLPHHSTLARRWDVGHLRALLPPGLVLVGLDEATGLIMPEARVEGAGQVAVYGPRGVTAYKAGARAPITPLIT